MSATIDIIEDVLKKIGPSETTLEAVRQRRDEVRAAARSYDGALRTYIAGSIAHNTANDDTDADLGLVLDRRSYPDLTPDGNGEGPETIVEEVRTYLREVFEERHPNIYFRLTKRAIKITFHEPLWDGLDPSVDLIVALTRKAGDGLWIPNLRDKDWDVSDPECHTKLLTADPANLRRTRAKAIRAAKGWNKQFAEPGLCSFNIAALALSAVKEGQGLASGLRAVFEYGARDLAQRFTPDPAGVSAPIKTLIPRESIAERMKKASELLKRATENDGSDEGQDALAELFWHHVDPPVGSSSKAALAATLRKGNAGVSLSGLLGVGNNVSPLKTTRAFGSDSH